MEKAEKKISIDLALKLCGDVGEDITCSMSKTLGLDIIRVNMQKYISCALEKENQNNVPKKSLHKTVRKENGRVFLYISTIKRLME